MEYYVKNLNNGLRTVFKHNDSPVVHIGLIVGAGSRDEATNEHGLAHFIEHTVFKGTQKRKSFHILSYIDNIGGEINAFTSREETCLYASVPAEHAERAMDLLSDVFFHCTFPEKEIEKEKEVVIEEIKYYRDLPDETILDDFEERLFPDHPLGRNILGKPSVIKSFTPKRIRDFIREHYTADCTLISGTGGINNALWEKLTAKYFGDSSLLPIAPVRKPFESYTPFDIRIPKKTHQSHCVMGAAAYSFANPRRTGLVLLNNVLGGPGNNSRLNLSIRERHGLAYNVESNYNPYSDTGTFLIYVGADPKQMEKAVLLARTELQKLCTEKLGTLQLQRAKQQICGQMILAHESPLAEMLSMGKSLLIRNEVYSLEDAIADINSLNASELLDIANDIFDSSRISTLVYTHK